MLASLLTLSLLVTGITAQSTSLPSGFDPSLVSQDEKNAWCTAQTNTCPEICGGATKVNRCDPGALTYDCVCSNGTTPDVSPYINTLPFFICNANFGQCIDRHPNDAEGQKECKEAQKQCGTLDATEINESEEDDEATTTAAAPTGTAAATSASLTATATGESPSATDTGNAAAALQLAETYSWGVLAAVFFGVFGVLA
ncbi:hypothetical protein VTO42DRAFT_1825 [Malbranchea cinnamomea]